MITLTTLKSHLQIQSVTFDGLLANYILWATSAIEDYCEQPIAQQFRVLPVVNEHPLDVNVLSVGFLQGRDDQAAAWQLLPLTEYAVIDTAYSKAFRITAPYRFYQAGLLVGLQPIPRAIELVCYEMCKELAQNDGILGGESTFRVQSVAKSKGGDTTTTVLANLTNRHKQLLAPYRKISIR